MRGRMRGQKAVGPLRTVNISEANDVTRKVASESGAQKAGATPQLDPVAAAATRELDEGSARSASAADLRRNEIQELPTMQRFTGLAPVAQGVTIAVVPLRNGAAAACHLPCS